MKTGFSKINITPPMGTALCGQLFSYKAKGVESELYANAMYVDDGKTAVLIISCDVVVITNEMAAQLRSRIESATGIGASNIVICSTHTHSGPSTMEVFGMGSAGSYCESLKSNVVEAAKQACENATEGKFVTASGHVEGYAFNRRFIMSDGTIETYPLKLDPHIVKAEGPDSTDIHVFCGYDKSDKPVGAVVIFGCHATVMERDNELVSSDFPGKVSQFVNDKLGSGAVTLFLQGACGNICYNSTGGIGHQKFGIAINNRNFYDTEASSYNIITNNTCVNNEVEQISDRGFFNDLSHNITYLYDE